jgi:acyl-coenzyme A thioesterase PaaI-like protein
MSEQSIFEIIHEKTSPHHKGLLLPPPCFVALKGEFLDYDEENKMIKTRFPILKEFLNPYSSLQGGIVAAVIDNTIGPLSVLVAPPNVTREMRVKYSRPATLDVEYLFVKARFLGRDGKRLKFSTTVRDRNNKLYARADSVHVII